MLYKFQVATAESSDFIVEGLRKRLPWISQKGLYLDIKQDMMKDSGIELVNLRLEGESCHYVFKEEDVYQVFCHQLAEVVAEHVVVNCEAKLLRKEINRVSRKTSIEEKDIIFTKAHNIMHNCVNSESLNLLLRFGRKNRISQRVLEHIKNNDRLLVEGFINFCLQDYLIEIKHAVEVALQELKNEREYSEFINLLRYFVDSQKPKMNEVNLMMNGDGIYYLWDGSGAAIDEKYINYYLDEMLLNEISLDDVLVSILITIAPKKIILHNCQEEHLACESVLMIRRVFKERIQDCLGCEKCHPGQSKTTKGS